MFWKYKPDVETYQWIDFIDYWSGYQEAQEQQSFEGLKRKVHDVFTIEEDQIKPISDFPPLPASSLLPVFSGRALDELWYLISDSVETAKLRWINHPNHPIYVVYVTRVVDCLDRKQSELVFYRDGTVMDIRKPVFFAERLEGIHIFRLPDKRVSPVYVSDTFRQAVIQNDLTGLLFE
jgi:hypothetical protein